jgi:hypothetical protein
MTCPHSRSNYHSPAPVNMASNFTAGAMGGMGSVGVNGMVGSSASSRRQSLANRPSSPPHIRVNSLLQWTLQRNHSFA